MGEWARTSDLLTRREALRRVSALLGGAALVGQTAWLAGCEGSLNARRDMTFTGEELMLLDEIAETILPATSTPGAKAAGVGAFIAMMVTDTYSPQQQRVFRDGLRAMMRECEAQHGTGFMTATAVQRHALLERLDREQLGPVPPGSGPRPY
jgi:hypothetical protein